MNAAADGQAPASPGRKIALHRILPAFGMAVLAAGALGKLADIGLFLESLRTWRSIPRELDVLITAIVPAVELSIPVAWFIGYARSASLSAAIVLVTSFSVLYAAQPIAAEPPTCSCMGAWERFGAIKAMGEHVLVRNGVILGLLLSGLVVERIVR